MKNPERILVVSMGTKQALKAVQWGISLARNYGAELFITHIVHNPFGLKGWSLPISSAKIIEDEFTKILEDAPQGPSGLYQDGRFRRTDHPGKRHPGESCEGNHKIDFRKKY